MAETGSEEFGWSAGWLTVQFIRGWSYLLRDSRPGRRAVGMIVDDGRSEIIENFPTVIERFAQEGRAGASAELIGECDELGT